MQAYPTLVENMPPANGQGSYAPCSDFRAALQGGDFTAGAPTLLSLTEPRPELPDPFYAVIIDVHGTCLSPSSLLYNDIGFDRRQWDRGREHLRVRSFAPLNLHIEALAPLALGRGTLFMQGEV